jgi:hypothetical protein
VGAVLDEQSHRHESAGHVSATGAESAVCV